MLTDPSARAVRFSPQKKGFGVFIVWIAAGVVLLAVELHHFAFYALLAAVGCFESDGLLGAAQTLRSVLDAAPTTGTKS